MLIRFGLFLLPNLPLFAQAGESTPAAVGVGIGAGSIVQAMLALLLIIGLLVATAWLARKVSGGKVFGQAGLSVIGGVALGPRERLVLVEVGDTWLVIGIVPGQIRTLHSLPKGSVLPGDKDNAEDKFAHWLKTISERRNKDG